MELDDSDNIIKEKSGTNMVQSVAAPKKKPSLNKVETCEIGVQKESGVDIYVQADCYRSGSIQRPSTDNQNSQFNTFSRMTGQSGRVNPSEFNFEQ